MAKSLTLGFVNTYAERLEGLYMPLRPSGFDSPSLIHLNRELLGELNLDIRLVEEHAAGLFSGSLVAEDSKPLAQAYAGHQFGGFAPQLGDGRAVLIGEVRDREDRLRDLQLKGSGPTPFSRGGDGKATIGPILREYLMGEAMHHLGIPTTRVLAAVATGETIFRSEGLPGAVLTRVAASHLRIGTLEFFAARRQPEQIARLVDYALERHYPERVGRDNPARELLFAVASAQADLVARWMHVGFIHGVMNTDNMTLSGETIDYGPCAFLEVYEPATRYSSIDHQGRYAYGNQPAIAQWNLARMGESLIPLLATEQEEAIELVEQALTLFVDRYRRRWLEGMRAKLGLLDEHEADQDLADDLLSWMRQKELDFTNTFRGLADGLVDSTKTPEDPLFEAWSKRWHDRLEGEESLATAARMNAHNPRFIARNHRVEEALDAAIGGKLQAFETLLDVLRSPFEDQPGREDFTEPAPADFGPYRTFCGT